MSSAFKRRLATIAQQQFDKYRWLRENQEPLASQIKAYWTDLGLAFPNVAQYAPKIGDILQNNRGHGTYTFQYAATHRSYPSHCAIVMEVGVDSKGNYLQTIGGNEPESKSPPQGAEYGDIQYPRGDAPRGGEFTRHD